MLKWKCSEVVLCILGCLSDKEHQLCGWETSCSDLSTVIGCSDTDYASDCFCSDGIELADEICIYPDTCFSK